ncbi:hypothetical protein B0H13DRAFT_2394680 [Mycena leptocephala]|nr:hypothetical protein B0H13DRAFT_2394680 [Mycena leptocephala]
MSGEDNRANPERVQSETDKLIAALQSCFQDLGKEQKEQADRLHKAVEALKQQAPATEKDSITHLDTALIFGGLFSAVSSAFIIQIQPQVVPPNPPTIIVVVQSLLYISLFMTLLAALLAVLGKQWIMHYQAAGNRGAVEERGVERQRKLDGLRRWKFEVVLQTFPLLLQLALLLFSSAMSIYLWTIHHSIAIIVLLLTLLGFSSYMVLLGSAIIFPDSPFQSSEDILMTELLKELQVGTDVPPTLIVKILNTTANLGKKRIRHQYPPRKDTHNLLKEIAMFCNSRADGQLDVLVSATTLARVDNIKAWEGIWNGFASTNTQEVGWIYLALEYVQNSWEANSNSAADANRWDSNTALEVESVLQMLLHVGPGVPPHRPTAQSLRVILQAVSTNSDISYYALRILHANPAWFTDPDMGQIIRKSSVWSHLGHIAFDNPGATRDCYIELGRNISSIPEWKPIMYKDLVPWIAVFFSGGWESRYLRLESFISVVRNVWVANFDAQSPFKDKAQESWALALTALANVWETFHFTEPPTCPDFVPLASCTVSIYFGPSILAVQVSEVQV